jgi:hypothetical protein
LYIACRLWKLSRSIFKAALYWIHFHSLVICPLLIFLCHFWNDILRMTSTAYVIYKDMNYITMWFWLHHRFYLTKKIWSWILLISHFSFWFSCSAYNFQTKIVFKDLVRKSIKRRRTIIISYILLWHTWTSDFKRVH